MLKLPQALRDEIIAHCRSRYPKEACGLLAGRRPAPLVPPGGPEQLVMQGDMVVAVYPMTNVEDSPIGYSMDPKEQLRAEAFMFSRHERMIGIYHSHTATAAYPSPVDVRLSISPDISYVLVSLKRPDEPVIKSYRIDGATITEEPVTVT